MSKLNKGQSEIRYLSPVDIDKRNRDKYCRFKKMGIKYIDYKDPDFLMRFLNEQGKILPRRLTRHNNFGLAWRTNNKVQFFK